MEQCPRPMSGYALRFLPRPAQCNRISAGYTNIRQEAIAQKTIAMERVSRLAVVAVEMPVAIIAGGS